MFPQGHGNYMPYIGLGQPHAEDIETVGGKVVSFTSYHDQRGTVGDVMYGVEDHITRYEYTGVL